MTEQITVSRELLRVVLYVIDAWERNCDHEDYWRDRDDAITALSTALSGASSEAKEQPVQEPVAEVVYLERGGNVGIATRIVEIDDPFRDRLQAGTKLYAAPQAQQPNGWIRAIDEEMVSTHLGVANITDSYEDAKRKLNTLICWHVDVSHDPKVNGKQPQLLTDDLAACHKDAARYQWIASDPYHDGYAWWTQDICIVESDDSNVIPTKEQVDAAIDAAMEST